MTEGSSLAGRNYPPTRPTLVAAAAGSDPDARARAMETLAAAYWRPVYATLRLRHGMEPPDAEDATQAFLGDAFAREWFARYDPALGRFRTFLRACLDRHVGHARAAAGREKRGGRSTVVPIDAPGVEAELAAGTDPDAVFEREWARGVVAVALGRLEAQCAASGHATRLDVFRRYDLAESGGAERPTYAGIARDLGIPVTQVTNHLHWARREFRRHVLETLRELTADDAEFRAEARALLGEAAL
jgi:DNA-directed RNA polymerase specialized sigma24 family protein